MLFMDKDFLQELNKNKNKIIYGKIILLTQDELPIKEIEGTITQGSINIDGNSSMRRTCSLTMVGDNSFTDIDLIEFALKNKFKLEVGIKNDINPDFPQIIWFKQGLYVFTSVNINKQSNNFTISFNGKDKTCLLNGECGGAINASTDFGKLEEYTTLDSGEIIRKVTYIPIAEIIYNILHLYAHEPLNNIVIKDIEDYGLELLEYRGEKSLYMPRHIDDGVVSNITTDGTQKYYKAKNKQEEIMLSNIETYYDRTNLSSEEATVVYDSNNNQYNIIKVEYGETAGYRKTDLTYPGDLIANVGETLISVLDKIKNMFADFEYFYDVDGKFVFQKKKTYVNTSWNNIQKNEKETYVENAKYVSDVIYSFKDEEMFSAITNNPNIGNVKNDFSIWGERQGDGGEKMRIHMRYAIDFKPTYYLPLRFDDDGNQLFDHNPFTSEQYDWREIIYQMALDYLKYNHKKDNFTQLVAAANRTYYPTGITGYESYYVDLHGFWRQLYNPCSIGMTPTEDNYCELNIENGVGTGLFSVEDGFNFNVHNRPELLDFWFDFLDPRGTDMEKYAVQIIGARPKTVNNNKITSIYYQEVPNILFTKSNEDVEKKDFPGYTFIQLTNQIESCFTISSQGLSAKDELDNLLYQHSYANETKTLTCIPIYHLEPNKKIQVKDEKYIVNKITIPLQYNGTSSISVTKETTRIY